MMNIRVIESPVDWDSIEEIEETQVIEGPFDPRPKSDFCPRLVGSVGRASDWVLGYYSIQREYE
jgi:hypothetical protein